MAYNSAFLFVLLSTGLEVVIHMNGVEGGREKGVFLASSIRFN